MPRLPLLLLLAACAGGSDPDDTDDTDPVEDVDQDGFTEAEGDCDDEDAAIHPDATEVYYDGVDQDCSGGSDDDADGDGFDAEAEGGDDCDDTKPEVNPDATDVFYDGVDADCDGASDYDADGDGYPSDAHGGNDCDDTKALVNPGADELCSTAYDDDCDESVNEADATDATEWYLDADADTFGSPDGSQTACTAPEDHVADGTDCDDEPSAGGATVHPGADDVACDGYDNDCDPLTFEAAAVLVDDTPTAGTLASVLGAATAGQVVTACEGKHTVQSATITAGITLRGMGSTLTVLEAPQIDIDPGTPVVMHGAPLLRVATTAPVTIEDLTLTGGGGFEHGNDRNGGGLYLVDEAEVTVTDAIITANHAGFGSGAYVGVNASLALVRVSVTDNIGDDDAAFVYPIGGGLYLDEGAALTIHDGTIEGNEAEIGGGIAAAAGASISGTGRTSITNNRADLTGGGIDLDDGGSISGLVLADNIGGNGGGVHVTDTTIDPDPITLTDVVIHSNGGVTVGGGLSGVGQIILERVQITANTAITGGNMHLTGDSTVVTMTEGAVRAGSIGIGDGGGAYLSDATLQCTNVDWGVGEEDNEKEDVWLERALPLGAGRQAFFGESATFVLDDEEGGCYEILGDTCN